MSGSGSLSSPSKDSLCGTTSSLGAGEERADLPRDFSRLSLFSTGSATSQDLHFHSARHAEHSLSCMRHYLQAGKLCDVVLIAGINGRKVSAHRLVLSAASEYFSAMFTGSMRETEQEEITLQEVNGDVLNALVNYCYTGTIEIREDNVEILLATACLMQLKEVTEACSRFLAHQLHPSNCLGIAAFAEHQHCLSLLKQANSYINLHFMQVIKNQEFLQLAVDQMAVLLESDGLNVASEEEVFHALIGWVNHNPTIRRVHIARLLALVKLPLLDPAFLTDQVESVVESDPVCQTLLLEAMKWHLLPERRLQMLHARTRPRKATLGRVLVIGGMDKYKGSNTMETYDPRSDKWQVAPHLTGFKRLQFGIARMGDQLLVVGGRDGLKTLNLMECLDLNSVTWSQYPPMNTHRHGLGVAVLGGALYAVGGHDGWSYLNTVERWDPTTRHWKYVGAMQSQRCTAGVAVLDGKLYAIGGRDGASCLRTVEYYDPFTDKWTSCASMTHRRGGVGVAVANGYLYAMGGQDAPANNPAASRFDCIERYDPGSNSWTVVASLSSKRDAVAACLFGSHILAVGGYDGNNYLSTVEQYDPNTNELTVLSPLITGRAGACIVPVSHQHLQLETELNL